MLKFLKWFFGLFSPCVNSFERKVDRFFKRIKSTDGISSIKRGLLGLMNENLIVVNVWMEKKFKGYNYLTKSVRKKMYKDEKKIVAKWNEFTKQNPIKNEEVKAELEAKGLTFPTGQEDQVKCLYSIMKFLEPGEYYKYIKTASFGKLLRDPNERMLEGDCNQIVTLYSYLYSTKFPIEDLRIKLLPEHVCLHFRNIDIEATNGTFQKYTENKDVLPITEIISTNLLDLLDFREEVQKITPRVVVKSAQLAYAISSLKSLVAKNLEIAYQNLAAGALRANDFETGIFYLTKANNREALHNAYRNATIYYMDNKNFAKAKLYASKSGMGDLEKSVKYNEGIYYFNSGNISKALSIFTSLGDEKMKKACYGKQYNELVRKVSGDKTLQDIKNHKSTYNKMLQLAQKMGDSGLAQSVGDTLKQI